MANVKKSRDELNVELREQILALRSSCKAYDAGDKWEAKRIASSIYILFSDGGQNRSLLRQLGIKGKVQMLSTSVRLSPQAKKFGDKMAFRTANRLVTLVLNPSNARYEPRFGASPDFHIWMKFDEWWEEVAFGGVDIPMLSRKNIVFGLRNKDGGAHVDDALESYYYTVKHRGDPQVTVGVGNQTGVTVANALNATARQIGWEVDQSLLANGF